MMHKTGKLSETKRSTNRVGVYLQWAGLETQAPTRHSHALALVHTARFALPRPAGRAQGVLPSVPQSGGLFLKPDLIDSRCVRTHMRYKTCSQGTVCCT